MVQVKSLVRFFIYWPLDLLAQYNIVFGLNYEPVHLGVEVGLGLSFSILLLYQISYRNKTTVGLSIDYQVNSSALDDSPGFEELVEVKLFFEFGDLLTDQIVFLLCVLHLLLDHVQQLGAFQKSLFFLCKEHWELLEFSG